MNRKYIPVFEAMICVNCYDQGKPKNMPAGSAVVELFLYLFTLPFLCIPALFYSHWRTKNANKVCKQCGGVMIPEDSPKAKEILKQLGNQ